jgi:hypothetical protein
MRAQTIKTMGDVYYYGFSDAANAMRWYQYAAKGDPTWNATPGAIYGDLGDSEAAARWLEPHRKKYPNEAFGVLADMNQKLRAGDTNGSVELALEALRMSRDTMPASIPLKVLQEEFLRQDRADELLQMYSQHYPELLYEEPDVHQANIGAAVNLLSIYRHTGDDAAAEQMSDIILSRSKAWPTVGIFGPKAVKAEVHAINGETTEAIAEIARLLDAGWVVYGADLVFRGPGMAELRADPEFRKLFETNDARVRAQLAEIRQLEKDGMIAQYPEHLPIIKIDVSSPID